MQTKYQHPFTVNTNGDLGLHRFQSMVSTGFNVREDEEGEKSSNNDLIIAEEGNTLSKAWKKTHNSGCDSRELYFVFS